MAKRSKRIEVYDKEKIKLINADTIKLFDKYNIDMTIRELKPKTISNYKSDLTQWFLYILDKQANACITDLNEDDITEFIYFCKVEGNNSRRIKRRLSSISAFYIFLKKKRLIKENPMDYIDRPKNDTDVVVQTYLTKEQVEIMKEKLEEIGDLQLTTYILFSLSTMARVNAVSNLKWEQIDFENEIVGDVIEKEGYSVTLYPDSNVFELLKELKKERNIKNIECEYVFISGSSDNYTNVTTSTMNKWCKKIGHAIGVETLHPHDLRHSGSQLLKLSGCPIEQISSLLNHKGLDVTKKHYLIEDKEQTKQIKSKYKIV